MFVTLLRDAVEFFGEGAIQDPYPLYARLRARGPVHEVADSGFHVVCGWDAVDEVINRPEDFSSNLTAVMTYAGGRVVPFEMDGLGGPSQVLATGDDPAHAAHRKMMVPELAAKRIRAMEPFITASFDRLWDDAVADGHVEWMSAVANRLPMMVVARLIGVPDDDVDQLSAWSYASTQLLDGLVDEAGLATSGTAAMQLAAYIADKFQHASRQPGDNLLGHLSTACATGEFDPVTAQVMMVILFSAGGESTGSLLGSAASVLATCPDVQQRVRADPTLLDTVIEEVLRLEPPFRGHYRHVVRDTSLAGVDVPRGARLLLLWGAANRDPVRFEDPDELRLDRPNAKSHLAFGKGAHFCVGAALARIQTRLVLRKMLERTRDITADDVGPWLPSILVRRREWLKLTPA